MRLFDRRARREAHTARGFTAAATILDLEDQAQQRRVKKGPQAWQEEAWRWYDDLGEISNAATWVSNALSRILLVPALIENPGEPPTILREDDLPDGVDAKTYGILNSQLRRLRGPDGGHSELNRLGALNLWVAGDCSLLGTLDDTGNETFDVLSVDELVIGEPKRLPDGSLSSRYSRRTAPSVASGGSDGSGPDSTVPISPDAFVCRIWRRHPRWSSWPNSGMRAANEMCRSLMKFTQEMNAVSDSRIPAGILAIPDSMDFGPSDPTDETGNGQQADTPFGNDLMLHMTTPIKDSASASRLMPYLVQGDGDDIEKIRYFDLSKVVDPELQNRITSTLSRLAVTIEVPADQMTGKADMTHWTAFTVDREAFKFYLEPLAIVWAMGLTAGYYRQAIASMGIEDPSRFCIWYDPTDLVSQPDDIETILKVDSQRPSLVSDRAIRQRANLSEDDAPDEEEVGQRIAMIQAQHARTTIAETPQQLITDAGGTPPATGPLAPKPPEHPDATPTNEAEPVSGGPQQTPPAGAPPAKMALTASATAHIGPRLGRIEQSVFLRVRQAANDATRRALERAGARLRSQAQKNGLAAMVKGADAIDIAGLLGKGVVEGQLATSAVDLLDGAYASLRPDWDKWTLAAQLAAIRALGLDPDDYRDDARLADARTAGWDTLLAGLMTAAAVLLYHPNQEAPARGEFDDTTLIGAKAIRDALEAAGGGPTEDGRGSLLFGAGMLDVLNVADLSPQGYVWVYGDEYRQRPFDGHEQLDDVEFADWTDDVLAVNADDDWIGDFYAPQDHDGCLCGFYRNVEASDTAAEEEAA